MPMKTYKIEYKEHAAGEVNSITVKANNTVDAYEKTYFDELHGQPYAAWVTSYIRKDGSEHIFNNFEGKPY